MIGDAECYLDNTDCFTGVVPADAHDFAARPPGGVTGTARSGAASHAMHCCVRNPLPLAPCAFPNPPYKYSMLCEFL